ncbi:tetratricopeptide repeat protein [Streptomyces sp. NPDC093568]|uniref:tetratricopeptide repeat protein n=1 Tax=Streptomyces sp. NPDC093568 TaxID=3366041 RepID=UPI0037F40A0B
MSEAREPTVPRVSQLMVWWLPEEEFDRARDLWPQFATEWRGQDFTDYCRRHDGFLRELTAFAENIAIMRVGLDAYLRWCEDTAVNDPWNRVHFSPYVTQSGDPSIKWPPRPDDACWCGRGAAYSSCCGTPLRMTPSQQDQLTAILFKLMSAQSWQQARALVERHPKLLEDDAEIALSILRSRNENRPHTLQAVETAGELLSRCREIGLHNAFDELLGWKVSTTNGLPDELVRAVSEVDQADSRCAAADSGADELAALVQAHRDLVALMDALQRPSGERRQARRMLLLALVRQYGATRNVEHLEDAASAIARSIQQPTRVTTALIRDLNDHAALLNVLRQLTQQPQSLGRLIEIINECVQDVPRQRRLALLAPLADAYFDRFQHWGNRTDLDRAIELHEESTQAPDVDPQERLLRVNQLGMMLRTRTLHTPNVRDLDRAIRALEAVRPSSLASEQHCGLLTNLGSYLRLRYEVMGRTGDLDGAIRSHERVLREGPPDGKQRPYALNNLGVAYLSRYERLEEREDLHRSIALIEESVQATPEDSPVRWERLHNLALARTAFVEEEPDSANLTEATAAVDAAEAVTPRDSPLSAYFPALRAVLLARRFALLGEASDNDTSIDAGEHALSALPVENLLHKSSVNELAHALMCRFRRLGDPGDLARAVELAEFAAARPESRWPDMPAQLLTLAMALTLAGEDERATGLYRTICMHLDRGDLQSRFAAACDWAMWACTRGNEEEIAEAARAALDTALRLARIWMPAGETTAHRSHRRAQMAGEVRDHLSQQLCCQAAHDFDVAQSLFIACSPQIGEAALCELMEAGEFTFVERYRMAAGRLRLLERSSLGVAGRAGNKPVLARLWSEFETLIGQFSGVPPTPISSLLRGS